MKMLTYVKNPKASCLKPQLSTGNELNSEVIKTYKNHLKIVYVVK